MAIITTADYETLTNSTLDAQESAYVTAMIPVVQDQIERYCDRKFDVATYYEWYKYAKFVLLNQYPINNVYYIGSPVNAGTFSNDDYNYQITDTGLTITDDAFTSNTLTFGGAVANLTDIKTWVEANYPLITLDIVSGYASLRYQFLRTGTGREIIGTTRNDIQTKLLESENRTLEILRDSYTMMWDSCETNLHIVYNAGYAEADMPYMLQNIMVNIIKDVKNINDAGITGLYQSENITNYSYSLGAGVTEYVGKELDKYSADLDYFKKKYI